MGLFHGIIFLKGSFHFLPPDIALGLDEIRKWACEKGLVYDIESQIIVPEREEELFKIFQPDDELCVAIDIYKDSSGDLTYLEYPYIPVKTLIKKKKQIDLVFWWIDVGEVGFHFWYGDSAEEFCSLSTAKKVVKKFSELSEKFKDYGEKIDGRIEIEVDGAIQARFFKNGRYFDVELIERRGING